MMTCSAAIDLTKAFHSIGRNLLARLHAYGVRRGIFAVLPLYRRLISLVGRALTTVRGGRGFEPQTRATLRVLK